MFKITEDFSWIDYPVLDFLFKAYGWMFMISGLDLFPSFFRELVVKSLRVLRFLRGQLAVTFRLSRYAPNCAKANTPGAPCRLPMGSTLSIIHCAGSGSPVGQALPRAPKI